MSVSTALEQDRDGGAVMEGPYTPKQLKNRGLTLESLDRLSPSIVTLQSLMSDWPPNTLDSGYIPSPSPGGRSVEHFSYSSSDVATGSILGNSAGQFSCSSNLTTYSVESSAPSDCPWAGSDEDATRSLGGLFGNSRDVTCGRSRRVSFSKVITSSCIKGDDCNDDSQNEESYDSSSEDEQMDRSLMVSKGYNDSISRAEATTKGLVTPKTTSFFVREGSYTPPINIPKAKGYSSAHYRLHQMNSERDSLNSVVRNKASPTIRPPTSNSSTTSKFTAREHSIPSVVPPTTVGQSSLMRPRAYSCPEQKRPTPPRPPVPLYPCPSSEVGVHHSRNRSTPASMSWMTRLPEQPHTPTSSRDAVTDLTAGDSAQGHKRRVLVLSLPDVVVDANSVISPPCDTSRMDDEMNYLPGNNSRTSDNNSRTTGNHQMQETFNIPQSSSFGRRRRALSCDVTMEETVGRALRDIADEFESRKKRGSENLLVRMSRSFRRSFSRIFEGPSENIEEFFDRDEDHELILRSSRGGRSCATSPHDGRQRTDAWNSNYNGLTSVDASKNSVGSCRPERRSLPSNFQISQERSTRSSNVVPAVNESVFYEIRLAENYNSDEEGEPRYSMMCRGGEDFEYFL